jgi:hypothetical protein
MRQCLSVQAFAWEALVFVEGACATPIAHGVGLGDALIGVYVIARYEATMDCRASLAMTVFG